MFSEGTKEAYRDFSKNEPDIPVYSRPWYLDAVCGDNGWGVLLYTRDNKIVASMPYYITRRLAIKIIKMPSLTQSLGVYLKYPASIDSGSKLSLEKKVYSYFIERLPKVGAQFHNFHYSFTNWLPFFWKGYKQTTKYTYVIEDISDPESVTARFSHAKKKNIAKALKTVSVKFDLPAREFYDHLKFTIEQKGQRVLYPYETFERLYRSSYKNSSGRTIYAVDSDDNIQSAIFCVWDNSSAYDLISSIDDRFKNSGSATLLIQELIKYLSGKVTRFDFEGSMFESVENSFRQFGAVQRPYHRIYRIDNLIYKFVYQFLLNQV